MRRVQLWPLGSSVSGTPRNSYRRPLSNNNNVPILKTGTFIVSPPLTTNSARSSLMSTFPDELGSPLSMTHYDQQHHHHQHQQFFNNNTSLFSNSRLAASPHQPLTSPLSPPATLNYVFTSTSSSGGGNLHHAHASIACAPISEVFSYAMISTVNNTSSSGNTSISSEPGGVVDDDGGGGIRGYQQIIPAPLQQHSTQENQQQQQRSESSQQYHLKQYGSFDDSSDHNTTTASAADNTPTVSKVEGRPALHHQFTVSFTNDYVDDDNQQQRDGDVSEFRPQIIVVDEQPQQEKCGNSGGGEIDNSNSDEEEESPSPDLSIVTKADTHTTMGRSFSSKTTKDEERDGGVSSTPPISLPPPTKNGASFFHPPTTTSSPHQVNQSA